MQKNIVGLKKLKVKIVEKRKDFKKRKEKKEERKRKAPQSCKSPTQMQRFIVTIKSVTEYTHIYIHP